MNISNKSSDQDLSTVDTLLSEIEKEIPASASRQIPLQDIGDDTMEKIVSYNTRSNSSLGAQEEDHNESAERPLLEPRNRKSVMFNDKPELHEYSGTETSVAAEELQKHLDEATAVAWNLSSLPQPDIEKKKKTRDLSHDHRQEDEANDQHHRVSSGSECSQSSLLLTTEELRSNSVANLHDRLDLVLGSKPGSPNVPKLKEMINHVDNLAFAPSMDRTAQTKPLRITFESTPPLGGNNPQHELLEYEIQSSESDEEVFSRIPHSPSKIPTTNTIRINRLANSPTLRPNQEPSRVSSGSSMDESITDLETTMKQDKFNLLRTSVPLAGNNIHEIARSDFEMSNRSLIVSDAARNDSRVFSMATTADEFQSARESAESYSSADESQQFQAIEDLQISEGLVREDNTLTKINEIVKLGDYHHSNSGAYSKGNKFLPSDFDLSGEDMVKSPSTSTVQVSSLQDLNKANSADVEVEDEHLGDKSVETSDQIEESSDDNSENSSSSIDEEEEVALPVSKDRGETNDAFANEEKTQDPTAAIVAERVPAEVREPNEGFLKDTRVISNNLANVFDEDAIFADIGDTSQDSVDITYSLKPTYLSIWHSQEVSSSASPTISSHSQFSHQSNITSESSSSAPSNFKLKPRIVSRTKIYYPRTRPSPRIGQDEIHQMKNSSSSTFDPLRSKWAQSTQLEFSKKHSHEENIPSIARIALAQAESGQGPRAALNLKVDSRTHEPRQHESREAEEVDTEESISGKVAETDGKRTQILEDSLQFTDLGDDSFDLADDFEQLLKTFSHGNTSSNEPSKPNGDPVVYHIWGEDNYHNAVELSFEDEHDNATSTKKGINEKLLTKLLSGEGNTAEEGPNQNEVSGLGILKSADSDVAVYNIESVKGFEAIRSASGETDKPLKSSTPSPVKSTHVESPFKTVRAKNLCSPKKLLTESPVRSINVQENQTRQIENEPSVRNSTEETVTNPSGQERKLQDHGKLYILIKSIKAIKLEGISQHKAEIAMEFDNGINVVQTPWTPLEKNAIEMNQEYELIMKDIKPTLCAQITLKCRYQRPTSQLVEVTERIPTKKKFSFGKPKYTLRKTFVNKKVEYDSWDHLFAQDGSFARCKLPVDESHLEGNAFRRKKYSYPLYNEWKRDTAMSQDGKNVHNLPRQPAYKIGEIELEMCFLSRTSEFEKFPKTLELAHDVVNKFAEQQDIKFEGFLWQEGGDVDGLLQKRYYVLKGTQLIAHHEITRTPQALINLLKVVSVVGEGQLTEEAAQKVRNFTDMVLFSECFKLIFENGEIINLDAESADLKAKWTALITQVVGLNKFHQPWVKHVLNNRLLDF
ncbi:LAFA_0G06986g1_1 [Lachancea sp. 'fantastica']|nr:LAFA_0G06986g1_1 [Lachancea sp. 'fantastica']